MSQLNVEILQTAASLENLAAGAYASARRLAAVREGPAALLVFMRRTQAQHEAHARAFNAQAVKDGGKAQHAADPRFTEVVRAVLSRRAGIAQVLGLAESLEDTLVQTCTRYASLTSQALRPLFVATAAVDAQHRAYLLAVLGFTEDGQFWLVDGATMLGRLPAQIGAACLPFAFYPTAGARAIDEGAVR
jgi:hypothetical protein